MNPVATSSVVLINIPRHNISCLHEIAIEAWASDFIEDCYTLLLLSWFNFCNSHGVEPLKCMICCKSAIHISKVTEVCKWLIVFYVRLTEEPPPQLPPPRHRKVPPSLSNAATPQDGDHDRTLVVKQVSLCQYYYFLCWSGYQLQWSMYCIVLLM